MTQGCALQDQYLNARTIDLMCHYSGLPNSATSETVISCNTWMPNDPDQVSQIKGLMGYKNRVSYTERRARFSIRLSLPNWVKERPAEKQFDAYRKSGNTRHFTKVSRQVSGLLCRFRNRIPISLASLVTIEST